jgi:hypothetical protein
MKVKGLAGNLGTDFGGSGRSRVIFEGTQNASVVLVSAGRGSNGVDSAVFGVGGVAAGNGPACCHGALTALVWLWARVEDESKCRRQGLVVCRATLPFEGFCEARPGVTLAPAFFFGVAACQSRTICL